MKRLPALLIVAAAGASAARAHAEDTSDLEGLLDESVVSAASKSPEAASTAPAMSISISAEEIRQHGIRTVDEAINFLAMGMQLERSSSIAEIGQSLTAKARCPRYGAISLDHIRSIASQYRGRSDSLLYRSLVRDAGGRDQVAPNP